MRFTRATLVYSTMCFAMAGLAANADVPRIASHQASSNVQVAPPQAQSSEIDTLDNPDANAPAISTSSSTLRINSHRASSQPNALQLPLMPGFPTPNSTMSPTTSDFNSTACGAMDYQGMHLQKPAPAADPCAGQATHLLVNTNLHTLNLCENGQTVASYDIAIGANGVGKHLDGDRKTPIGTYPLATPRKSTRFGLFILVGYPTPEQIRSGATGDSIGIHGPERGNQCKGLANVERDWTDGCMAVTNDVFILEIAQFVASHPGINVTIQ